MIVIGDSYNDFVMIEFVGFGVVMGNVFEDIKEKVNYVIDINMNDGVVKVVEEFILRFVSVL